MSDTIEYVYEVVENSSEVYYTHGIFLSLEDAEGALESDDGCPPFDGFSDYVVAEIRKRKIGWDEHETGKLVKTYEWREEYDEEKDENVWIREELDV